VNDRGGRRQAYLVLAGGCLAAGLCGALFDQISATISPEYFLEGKNLADSSLPFRWAVAWMGFRAALPLGAVVTGAALVESRSGPRFAWRPWLWRVVSMMGLTIVGCAVLMPALDPFRVRAIGEWPADVTTRLLVCWGMHFGAYLGALAGVMRELMRAPPLGLAPRL
jgi:hypothetical protein